MNIDIKELKNRNTSSISIDEMYSFTKEQLVNTDILELNNLHITGNIINNEEEYYINLVLDGKMILKDSLTLEPVDFPLNVKIEGNIDELLEEIGENYKKSEFSIDIFPIIWENILMEIPIKVVGENSYNSKLEGEGWKFIQDDELTTTNPEFEKLKDLFK